MEMIGIGETAQGKVCRLSLAISLKDGYTGGRPLGEVKLLLDGHIKPVLNPSGYHTFLNIPTGRYQIEIVSENYLDERVMVDIGDEPFTLKEISLTPRTRYPFPPGATLVRGSLKDFRGPISGAVLKGSLPESSFSGRTDERGEFVLFFGPLKDEEVMKEGKTTFVKGPNAECNEKDIPISGEYHSEDGRLLQIETQLNDVSVGATNFRDLVLTASAPSPVKVHEENEPRTSLKGVTAKSRSKGRRSDNVFSLSDPQDIPEFF
jgi:hypothetical protein